MAIETNILSEDGLKLQAQPSCVFVLFGATGDLTKKKIAPALYNLYADGMLSENFAVLGASRKEMSDDEFRNFIAESIQKNSRQKLDPKIWQKFSRCWMYEKFEASHFEDYKLLTERLNQLDKKCNTGGNRLFYLAVTPEAFPAIIANLGKAGLSKTTTDAFVSVIIEKPFGTDLTSARQLNEILLKNFDESQVYRIDHYLGKETVQNILALRFANSLFEPMLNNHNVDHVQISVSETVGMEGRRGPYYETAGALRDMVQNHLLQLVALTAMEPPIRLTSEEIRNEKLKVLHSLRILSPEEVATHTVRGRYSAGKDPDGNMVAGYLQENGVSPNSKTETFVALKLYVENLRWSGVPFYLRTGKRLAAKASQITVVFRQLPLNLFSMAECNISGPNRLIIRIYPNEGVVLVFDSKVPGPDMILRPVKMEFQYKSAFQWASPEAYEHLLLDALIGDRMLFVRNDEVEAAWRFTDSIRYAWQNIGKPELVDYPPFSWGPPKAQELYGDPYKHWYD